VLPDLGTRKQSISAGRKRLAGRIARGSREPEQNGTKMEFLACPSRRSARLTFSTSRSGAPGPARGPEGFPTGRARPTHACLHPRRGVPDLAAGCPAEMPTLRLATGRVANADDARHHISASVAVQVQNIPLMPIIRAMLLAPACDRPVHCDPLTTVRKAYSLAITHVCCHGNEYSQRSPGTAP
jgi:hypothetical protein